MTCFGLKLGQDLGSRAGHPYQEFQRVPPPGIRAEVKDSFLYLMWCLISLVGLMLSGKFMSSL